MLLIIVLSFQFEELLLKLHVNPWLIHVNVWQKPLQYCKIISLQLVKINEKKKKEFYLQKRE